MGVNAFELATPQPRGVGPGARAGSTSKSCAHGAFNPGVAPAPLNPRCSGIMSPSSERERERTSADASASASSAALGPQEVQLPHCMAHRGAGTATGTPLPAIAATAGRGWTAAVLLRTPPDAGHEASGALLHSLPPLPDNSAAIAASSGGSSSLRAVQIVARPASSAVAVRRMAAAMLAAKRGCSAGSVSGFS